MPTDLLPTCSPLPAWNVPSASLHTTACPPGLHLHITWTGQGPSPLCHRSTDGPMHIHTCTRVHMHTHTRTCMHTGRPGAGAHAGCQVNGQTSEPEVSWNQCSNKAHYSRALLCNLISIDNLGDDSTCQEQRPLLLHLARVPCTQQMLICLNGEPQAGVCGEEEEERGRGEMLQSQRQLPWSQAPRRSSSFFKILFLKNIQPSITQTRGVVVFRYQI